MHAAVVLFNRFKLVVIFRKTVEEISWKHWTSSIKCLLWTFNQGFVRPICIQP